MRADWRGNRPGIAAVVSMARRATDRARMIHLSSSPGSADGMATRTGRTGHWRIQVRLGTGRR